MLSSLNICSRESIIRRYDHEVKGKSIIKPLMGEKGFAPQDAAILRLGFDSYTGIAVSNGILPKFGDIDAYEMSAGSFDEAIRGIIAVGGKLPDPADKDNNFWSVNDNFCVPDSAYNPQSNPDGKYKLAQLVRMNEALFDMSTFFNIPMTSGKDSMKNDFIKEGIKISVPPTILYSIVAKIKDVRNTMTSEFKQAGDLIYLIGKTHDELGGSDFYKLFNELGANVPIVRKEDALRIYQKMMKAHEKNWLVSAHDLSDGGWLWPWLNRPLAVKWVFRLNYRITDYRLMPIYFPNLILVLSYLCIRIIQMHLKNYLVMTPRYWVKSVHHEKYKSVWLVNGWLILIMKLC